jgi:hypothetical protein
MQTRLLAGGGPANLSRIFNSNSTCDDVGRIFAVPSPTLTEVATKLNQAACHLRTSLFHGIIHQETEFRELHISSCWTLKTLGIFMWWTVYLCSGATVLSASNTCEFGGGGRAFRNTQVSLQGRNMSLTFTCAQCRSGLCELFFINSLLAIRIT